MSFWDVVWFIIIGYAFVAYLILLFSIIHDLFRDRDVSGFAKAVWVLGLILLPLLTALVYVIVRGQGMARRAVARAEEQERQRDEYIRQVAGRPAPASPTDQIAQARALFDAGAISQSEYEALKSKALV
ncbi:SHOCT domain-containing protein [Trujillonella endophytica]|uniref:Phospholipase_D-nuclease N-terminal n=1 Tax=Trujillonella endophytica TaxID=673521 RepID=A0A1H8QQC7_9ACTN|nr:SHOCT domain-containing protein [Trujillella endophytica]SEO56074.1 Phospholipase_D-nuclease N-terminal [Trujillella endophytica]